MSAGVSTRQREFPAIRGLCAVGVLLLASSARGDDGIVSRTSNILGWSVDHLPSPTLDPSGCGHPAEKLRNGSFLCDPDGLLTSLGAQRAETHLEDILALQSPCGRGDGEPKQHVEGGVAVVSRMLPSASSKSSVRRGIGGGGGGGNGAVTAEQFARGVQDSWRVGKRGCDNGFLLVASREDRSFAIAVGKGLELYLTPKDRNAALNSMKPLLREGDWDAAVLVALGEIHDRLQANLSGGERGGGADARVMSFFDQGWDNLKQRVAAGWGGGGGGSGSGGGGGGGGGVFQDFGLHDIPPGFGLLALSLLWGGAAARRASLQRRQYHGFEAKLAGIEAQRASLPPSAGGGRSVGQDALASPGACPICLDTFSAAAAAAAAAAGGGHGGVGDGGGLIGSDGLPAARTGCGHTFCQSCLSRWHGERGSPDTHDGAGPFPCPICDSPPPALGDPRLGRPRRHRRLAPQRRRQRPARRPRPRRGTFGFSWPGFSARGARATLPQAGTGGADLRFLSPGPPSGWESAATTAAQGMLAKSIAPPPPPPTPPPPSTPPPPPPPHRAILPPALGKASGAATRGALRATGGEQARERARREAAFRLASLGSQYPKFLDDRTVNRWLSKDYSSSWSRDPLLDMNRPPEIGGGAGGDHGAGSAKKGSGWVATRSSGFAGGSGGGGGRRSYGGGASSSATGGGW